MPNTWELPLRRIVIRAQTARMLNLLVPPYVLAPVGEMFEGGGVHDWQILNVRAAKRGLAFGNGLAGAGQESPTSARGVN